MQQPLTQIRINYKDYPECMFAMIAAYLPDYEANLLRTATGEVLFRHTNKDGHTYKNGLLHSYNDKPALIEGTRQEWYKNGVRHRDGDLPAVIDGKRREWYINGWLHRENDLPAIINRNYRSWWLNGMRHRLGSPAYISLKSKEWWENDVFILRERV